MKSKACCLYTAHIASSTLQAVYNLIIQATHCPPSKLGTHFTDLGRMEGFWIFPSISDGSWGVSLPFKNFLPFLMGFGEFVCFLVPPHFRSCTICLIVFCFVLFAFAMGLAWLIGFWFISFALGLACLITFCFFLFAFAMVLHG